MMMDFLLERLVVLLTDVRKLGSQPMLGKQLVNLLLKTGFWPYESVGSSSRIHRGPMTYRHHGCTIVPCVCLRGGRVRCQTLTSLGCQ